MSNEATAITIDQGREVETIERRGNVMTPMEMLDRAIANGSGVDVLEKLMGLQERYEKNQARKAFDEAMAAAKAEIPVIAKNRRVGFDSKKAGATRTDYRHEDLAQIAGIVTPLLAKHGLSYRYRTTSAPNEPITVTCIVSHRDGHSEENTLTAGRDDTGNKNSIQAIGSTITYLQRYTLKAALGLAASNDDDGESAGDGTETIDAQQAEWLRTCITEASANEAKLLEYFAGMSKSKIEKIEDMPAQYYSAAIDMLNKKRAQPAKGKVQADAG